MGLDDFQSGSEDQEKQKEEQEEEESEEDETSSQEDVGGLEAFKSENFIDKDESEEEGDKDSESSEDSENWIKDIGPRKWKHMSKAEQVEYIRENYVSDYYPDFQEDESWKWRFVCEVECSCGNTFTFRERGVCLDCGRRYENAGRTVVKTHEIEEQENVS